MNNVKFQPWVGNNYQNGFNGLRTLVLGESHYQWTKDLPLENYPTFTIECVEEQLVGDFTKSFWTKIAMALINKHPDIEDKRRFWHSISFYNYVQESAGFGARVRPLDSSWRASEVPFAEVLNHLRPELIISLGYRLWEMLPDLDGWEGPAIPNAPQKRTWIYPYEMNGRALLYTIKHPSSGFSPTEWHEHIQKATIAALKLRDANPE